MEKLELKQMQELLVDYVLKRISHDRKEIFEYNLQSYPELKEEVIQSQKLFNRIEETDFEKIASNRTRNTTYKVREKYKKGFSKSEKSFRNITRLVFPTLGLATILIMLFFTDSFNNLFKNSNSVKPLLHDSLFSDIDYNNLNYSGSNNLIAYNDVLVSDDVVDSLYNEFALDFISETEKIPVILESNLINEHKIFNNLENLEEEEFQLIYEEIKNEKFIL